MSRFGHVVVIALLLVIAHSASAGEISQLFSGGVFNTVWGESIDEVRSQHPTGKIEKFGEITQFVLKDGREVFKIHRPKKAPIRFGFDSVGRLNGVSIYFGGKEYGNVLHQLITLFGPHLPVEEGSYLVVKWPQDESIEISLASVPRSFGIDAVLTIMYFGLDSPGMSKDDLGL